jgi:hypothetical protein
MPGPRGMIREVLQETARHRHVAVVLPSSMAADPRVTDPLAFEITAQLDRRTDVRRVHDDPDAESLLKIIGGAIVFDDLPATVPELLWHRDAVSTIAIVVTADLPKSRRDEFPAILSRLESETRSAPNTERLTLVTIGDRDHLPQFPGRETSDVSLATVWWWNRIARWDVAAYMAQVDPAVAESRIVGDVKTETIVEIARWDLELAETMAKSWSGDPQDLGSFLNAQNLPARINDIAEQCGPRPSEAILDLWDCSLVDGWHDICSPSAHALTAEPKRIDRLVWAAQARVLLPWIEERREVLHERVKALMGRNRFQAALTDLFDEPPNTAGPIEIGPLRRIVELRLGGTDITVRSAARRLNNARNHLAHLEPLSLGQLRELVVAGAKLG